MNITIETVAGDPISIKTMGFSGGERHVQLTDLPAGDIAAFTIKARVQNANDLMDLLLVDNAIKSHYGASVDVNLELPYLPYARQDRVCAEGQAFSLQLMASLLNGMRLKQLVTWDCHSQIGIELTGASNVEPTEIIKNSNDLLAILQAEDSVLICPDKGALKRCTQLKHDLAIEHMVLCEKRRDPATGKITHTDVLVDNLSGKTAVITDDICDGGYTFIKIAEQLKQKQVNKIVLFVTHGIFSKGLAVFDGLVDRIFTTNSFPQEESHLVKVIDFTYDFKQ